MPPSQDLLWFPSLRYLLPLIVCVLCQSLRHVRPLQPHGLSGSSVHGVLQARILEWVAISYTQIKTFKSM